jgi:hypothetical protein
MSAGRFGCTLDLRDIAYKKAFPDEAIGGKVLSHALNRRMAAPARSSPSVVIPVKHHR